MNERKLAKPLCAVACLAMTLPLAGCEPADKAVGDTQDNEPKVAYDGTDRGDVTIGVIGSTQPADDKPLLEAFAASRLNAAYVSVEDMDDPSVAARSGVEDMVARVVDAIVICRINVTDADADDWDKALGEARKAGIPVVLADPAAPPADELLYAATFAVDDGAADATPIDDAIMTIIDDRPHARTMTVTTADESDGR